MQDDKPWVERPFLKLLLGAGGVYVAYLQLSVLNQKIYSHRYPLLSDPSQTDIFEFADLVQLMSAVFCLLFSLGSGWVRSERANPIPFWEIVLMGALFTFNVNTLNYSLYYIPYPVRVVGDKLGYLTAVVVAVFFSRLSSNRNTKLGPEKMWRALMITVGAMGFAYFYKFKQSQQQLYVASERWKGYALIGCSVITQALFSDSQAFNKVTYSPSPNHLMFSINIVTLFVNLAILLITGTLGLSIQFCMTHAEIATDIFWVSALNILGQISIYYVVVNFKQHMFPLISTTRKILTILYSIYYYKHATNLYMWICLVLVFGGIIYELFDELYYDLSGEIPLKIKKTGSQIQDKPHAE